MQISLAVLTALYFVLTFLFIQAKINRNAESPPQYFLLPTFSSSMVSSCFSSPWSTLSPLLLRFIYLICQAIRSAMSFLHHPWNGNLCDTNITLPAFLQLFALFMFSHSFSFYLSVFLKTTFEEQILVYSKTVGRAEISDIPHAPTDGYPPLT